MRFSFKDLLTQRAQTDRRYLEFLRVPAMSCGIYVLPPGAVDQQKPHAEDEIYYIVSGAAHMMVRERDGQVDDREVRSGDIIFVGAGLEHRFHTITEELTTLVVFSPAET